MKKISIIACLLSFAASFLVAQPDSQWRGKDRDGKYHGEKLLKAWPKNGPELVTSIEGLGEGYSSPAVTDDRIYVTSLEDDTGYIHTLARQPVSPGP